MSEASHLRIESIEHELTELCERSAFRQALFAKPTVSRALGVAAVVGTLLVAINQSDIILAGGFPPIWKIVLTYCVPYSVSSYSSAMFQVAFAKGAICQKAH